MLRGRQQCFEGVVAQLVECLTQRDPGSILDREKSFFVVTLGKLLTLLTFICSGHGDPDGVDKLVPASAGG